MPLPNTQALAMAGPKVGPFTLLGTFVVLEDKRCVKYLYWL